MPTLEITADQQERIEALREEMEAAHAGPYATVEIGDVITYLCDLADAVDDPERAVDVGSDGSTATDQQTVSELPREELREHLEERNRQHSDPDDHAEMDLYTIAAQYDITGRSEMTKDELIDAILDRAEQLSENPFTLVDVTFPGGTQEASAASSASDTTGETETEESSSETGDEDTAASQSTEETEETDETTSEEESNSGGQLNAMLSLLDTHDDKWEEADGDARYAVKLPDGTTETARTKDDVRALLFQHYR